MPPKTAVIYARVSTSQQNVSNQLLELRQTVERFGWRVMAELADDGISGSKGRSDRPAFELALLAPLQPFGDLVVDAVDRRGS